MITPLEHWPCVPRVIAQIDERGIGIEWWPGVVLAVVLAALWLLCARRSRRETHAPREGESR